EEARRHVKQLLHAVANNGSPTTWRETHGTAKADDEFVLAFAVTMERVAHKLADTETGQRAVPSSQSTSRTGRTQAKACVLRWLTCHGSR
ncbi:MAG: hypothetical protein AAF364_02325, partial [Pseudomonadota bacterium]